MHELSIAQALVEQVQSIATRENAKITAITVSLGTLSGVDADALDQAFKIIVEDTSLMNSRLEISKIPARIVCHSCNRESSPEFPFFACLHCGSLNFEISAGRDMLLQSVELEM